MILVVVFFEFYVFSTQMPTLVVQAENDAKITIKGETLYVFYDPFPYKSVSGSLNVAWPGGIDRLDLERNENAVNQSALLTAWFPINSTFGPYGAIDGDGVQKGLMASFDDAFSFKIVNANPFNVTLAFSSQTFIID
jgi:hypothetical protein